MLRRAGGDRTRTPPPLGQPLTEVSCTSRALGLVWLWRAVRVEVSRWEAEHGRSPAADAEVAAFLTRLPRRPAPPAALPGPAADGRHGPPGT